MNLHFTRRVAFAVLFATAGVDASAQGTTPVTPPRMPPPTAIPGLPQSLPDGAVVMMSVGPPTESPPTPETTPRSVGSVNVKAELLLSRLRGTTESTSARWQPVKVGSSVSLPLELPRAATALSVPGLDVPADTDPAVARKMLMERLRNLTDDERRAMAAQAQAPPPKALQWDVEATVLKADDEGADVAVKWKRLDAVAGRAPAVAANGTIESFRIPNGKQRFLDFVRLDGLPKEGAVGESVVVALSVDRLQPSLFTARQLEYQVWLVQGNGRVPIGHAQAFGLDGGRVELPLPAWRRSLDLAGMMKDPPRVDVGCNFRVSLTGALTESGDVELLMDAERALGILTAGGMSTHKKDGGRKRLVVKPGEVVAFDIPVTPSVISLGLGDGSAATFTTTGTPMIVGAPTLNSKGYGVTNGSLVFSVGEYFRNNPVQLLVSAKPLTDDATPAR